MPAFFIDLLWRRPDWADVYVGWMQPGQVMGADPTWEETVVLALLMDWTREDKVYQDVADADLHWVLDGTGHPPGIDFGRNLRGLREQIEATVDLMRLVGWHPGNGLGAAYYY